MRNNSRRCDGTNGRWASYEYLQKLNRDMAFEPLTEEDARRLESEAREHFGDDVLDRKVCVVTDVWVFPKSAVCVHIDDFPLRAMRAALAPRSWCAQHVVDYYDCSVIDPRLQGLLISKRTFSTGAGGQICAWFSASVLNELRAVETKLHRGSIIGTGITPPKFAIADGFVAGVFPQIDAATYIERQTVGLVQIRGVVKVVYGGPGNMLSSHLLSWDNRDATTANRIPSVVRREHFQLILAGPMTEAQEIVLAKRHECNGERVRAMHELLFRINPLYASIAIDDAFDPASSPGDDLTVRLPASDDVDQLIAQARARQSSVARMQDETDNIDTRESVIVESETVLMQTTVAGDEQDRLNHAVASVADAGGTYVARRSTELLKSSDPHFMERMFPHLLTFGIGGFSMARHHKYSPRAIVLHYLNLSTNRFAEDPLYKLAMFDHISSSRVRNNVFLRVGQDPSLATTAMRVTPVQLKTAMRNRSEQRKAWKQGRSFSPEPVPVATSVLLKSIISSTSKMWGSNEERESMARKVDSVTILYGAPSVFWTLTPNPDNSIVCAFWTGKDLPHGRPSSLSQCGEINMTCSSEMSRLIMSNTVVQAQYYLVCRDLLIDILFGWDTKSNKPKSRRGIFGSSIAAPSVARCDLCDDASDEHAIVSYLIEERWNVLDEDQKAISIELAVGCIRRRFDGLSSHIATAGVQLSRLLLKDQTHRWSHTRSCVKGRSGTKCRYNFFRDLIPRTGFDSDNELAYRRRLGNQYLNTFIELWRCILHFRVLWSGHGLQATRYALQYVMKRQVVLDNVAVVDLAFRIRFAREALLYTALFSKGVGSLLSLTHATSGVMEVGGPMATTILFEGEAVTITCTFERLVLLDVLSLLNGLAVQATVVTRNRDLFAESSISKYLSRPRCLENCCWYDFCTWYTRTGPLDARVHDRCTFVSNDSAALFEHVRRHNYRRLDYPRVPEIIGPRLPDSSRLGDEDYLDQTELYYRCVVLLYYPFRDVSVFLDTDRSVRSHFQRWNPVSNAIVARALERHQQFYICLQMAQHFRDKQRSAAGDESDSDCDNTCGDDDLVPSSELHGPNRDTSVRFEAVPAEYYSLHSGSDAGVPHGVHDDHEPDAGLPDPVAHLILGWISSSPLPRDDSGTIVNPVAVTRTQVRQFQPLDLGFGMNDAHVPPVSVGSRVSREVAVDTFTRSLQRLPFQRRDVTAGPLRPYATIQNVSTHFGLNHHQHIAFTLIAVPLLSKIVGFAPATAVPSLFDASPVIITGAGGTGKSQVIAAVRALAAAWDHPSAVSVVATTGIAAAGLRGSTMHSSVGLGINMTSVPAHIRNPSDALLRQWAPTLCVIADELSMIDLGFFGVWKESLRHAKDNLDVPYGGMLAVLMFDDCQVRTVRGMPMFRSKTLGASLTAAQGRGLGLYRAIKKVVYLTENMRFSRDPEWGRWLASARLGNWVPEIRSHIASCVELHVVQTTATSIQTISSDNITRSSTNDNAVQLAVRFFGGERRIYVIPARLCRRVSLSEIAFLRQLPDNKTGHVPLFLQLYIGMPVRVKSNQCVLKGAANGASASVHHIDWIPGTQFSPQADGTWLASMAPPNIYLNMLDSAPTVRFPGIPSHWPVTVMPVHQVTASIKTKGSSLSIKGFPIVPAFATTVHGVQGETRDSIIVTNLRPPNYSKVDTHALYVALSRIRTRQGLNWVGPLPTSADFHFFRPDPEVLVEDNRLKQMSATTIAAFDSISPSDISTFLRGAHT